MIQNNTNKLFLKKLFFTKIKKTYHEIAKSPKASLKNIANFYNLFKKYPAYYAPKAQPNVGYFCTTVPEEIIFAMGGNPIRLDISNYSFVKSGEEITSADICPTIKSIIGAVRNNFFNGIDILIIPSCCDAKTKLSELLSPLIDKFFFMELPRHNDYQTNSTQWVSSYKKLIDFLSKHIKTKINDKKLLAAVSIYNKRTEVFRQISDFRLQNAGIITSTDYFILANAAFISTPIEWTKMALALYREAIKTKKKSIKNKKRLLLCGSPLIFPDFKILNIIEELNAEISTDTLCSSRGFLYDPIIINEPTEDGIIKAICLKHCAASMCPCFTNNFDKYIDQIIDLVTTNNLDGVIYYNLRLCQVFEIQFSYIKEILKKNNIPVLFIKSDLGAQDIEQIKTRIEAFLEILGENN